MSDRRIFVSMGTPYSDYYLRFREALESFLRVQCESDPRIMGVNEYPTGNPLPKLCEVMRSCHGVIVVAYERTYVDAGETKRNSKDATKLISRTYTTPWNHIESAVAYSLGLPLYIICENGLTEEGLIEDKIDWYVQHIELTPEALQQPAVVQSLRSWVQERVVPSARRPRTWKALEGALKLKEMTPREIWGAAAVLFSVFLAGAFAGRMLPALFN
jgi:hypothetical protein